MGTALPGASTTSATGPKSSRTAPSLCSCIPFFLPGVKQFSQKPLQLLLFFRGKRGEGLSLLDFFIDCCFSLLRQADQKTASIFNASFALNESLALQFQEQLAY
jgi:hypothetical protein